MKELKKVECWRTTILSLEAENKLTNPFLEVEVTANFTGPNGEKLSLRGYWDGGQTYKIRFAPISVGIWSYTTSGSNNDPGLESEGEIECIPYEGSLPIYQHGFLKVDHQHDYLQYADNTPFLWLGDTHWSFITSERFEESNIFIYESQFKACVDKRVSQGFNVYQCNLREGFGIGTFSPSVPLLTETEDGILPDLERFKDVDRKMEYLADQGMVVALGFAWTDDLLRASTEHYLKLAEYFTARYGAFPVIWTLSGEMPWYIPNQKEYFIEEWRKVAQKVEELSPYQNLQTTHLRTETEIPEVYCGEKWFDFVMCQSGHGDYPASPIPYFNFKAKYPTIPLIESETFYEGIISRELNPRVLEADQMRKMAYYIMQAGGCGFTYGSNGIYELQWVAGDCQIDWGSLSWYDSLNLPGANQLTIWKKFYEYAGWSELKPIDIEIVDYFSPIGNPNKSPLFTANANKSRLVGYFSDVAWRKCKVNNLSGIIGEGFWMNPATGYELPFHEEITEGTLLLKAPDETSDWVVYIKCN